MPQDDSPTAVGHISFTSIPEQSNLHKHTLANELLYCISGSGEVRFEEDGVDITPFEKGESVFLPKNQLHQIFNTIPESLELWLTFDDDDRSDHDLES